MNPKSSRSVYRYFLPADAFVRILLCDGAQALSVEPGLNRTGYRRLLLSTLCPDFGDDLEGRLAELCPHDPLAAEDLLYQLCVEVNPQLDIHTVRLPSVEESPEESTAPAEDSLPWRERLGARSKGLHRRLARRIRGQDEALGSVERTLRRAAAGLGDPRRPLGTLLFVGRTGTGKTELARQLARDVFDGDGNEALVRVDCSEYALAHEYSKLIGAPPGYVGHEHGGFLTDAIRKRPDSLVLFDEIEKAHPRLHNLLLQILDDGHLADSRGRRVDFTRSLVVMTSNVGADEIRGASDRLGFSTSEVLGSGTLSEITDRALAAQFAPEFLGRIDERILFRELDPTDAREIARMLLTDLCDRAATREVHLTFTPAVATWVATRGYRPESGARELRRILQRDIEPPLAELCLSASRTRSIQIAIQDGTPTFRPAA